MWTPINTHLGQIFTVIVLQQKFNPQVHRSHATAKVSDREHFQPYLWYVKAHTLHQYQQCLPIIFFHFLRISSIVSTLSVYGSSLFCLSFTSCIFPECCQDTPSFVSTLPRWRIFRQHPQDGASFDSTLPRRRTSFDRSYSIRCSTVCPPVICKSIPSSLATRQDGGRMWCVCTLPLDHHCCEQYDYHLDWPCP